MWPQKKTQNREQFLSKNKRTQTEKVIDKHNK